MDVQAEELFHHFATSEDGRIDRLEFWTSMILLCTGDLPDRLELVFKMLDNDNNGYISEFELNKMLHMMLPRDMEVKPLSSNGRLSGLRSKKL